MFSSFVSAIKFYQKILYVFKIYLKLKTVTNLLDKIEMNLDFRTAHVKLALDDDPLSVNTFMCNGRGYALLKRINYFSSKPGMIFC